MAAVFTGAGFPWPLMGKGKMYDEAHPQQRDFPRTDPYVSLRQLGNHFLFVTMLEKKGLARIDYHLVAEVGARWHQRAKFFGAIRVTAWLAGQEHFPRPEPAKVHGTDRASSCFAHLQIASAAGTICHR